MTLYLDKTLTQIEKQDWGEPSCDSHLVKTCHQLRKKPLRDFTVDDLRIMIGQNISLEYLIPLAIEQLTGNILAEGDYYAGDLIKSVLDSDTQFWMKHKSYWQEVIKIYTDNQPILEGGKTFRQIRKSFDNFRNNMG